MHDFTPCELEIMEVLWRNDELKPAEILGQLDRPISNAALRSTMRVLMEKGHVTRRKRGKAYYYRPKKSASSAFKKMSRRLAEFFCDGSSYELIAELIKTEPLSEEDIRQLRKLAEDKSSSRK